MSNLQYTAGLRFVVSTPTQTKDENARKAIRSHATKAGRTRQQAIQPRSWISPNCELGSLKLNTSKKAPTLDASPSTLNLRPFGSAFSGLQLPAGVEPYMIQDLVKLIGLDKYGIYPYEICLDVNPVERGWFAYMINDICCLHSLMFSVRAFTEGTLPTNQLSRSARLHYAKALQILQARLDGSDQTLATSDSTIMVVFLLASAAELMEDFAVVGNHIRGLEKIVSLRGGVRKLATENNIQVKVCRADLSYALLSGHPPLLFGPGTISYESFIADNDALTIHCTHAPHSATIHAFFLATRADPRLHNTFRDMHAFSCISNLAYQTTRKLSPAIYNEIMISVLYRLTTLSFEEDALQETLRLALLVACSTLFMQRQFMNHYQHHPYEHLASCYRTALLKLLKLQSPLPRACSTDHGDVHMGDIIIPNGPGTLPTAVILWLSMMFAHVDVDIIAPNNKEEAEQSHQAPLPPADQLMMSAWLDEALRRAEIDSWSGAREMLRSMVWVDFVHDRRGKGAFEAAMLRLKRDKEGENQKQQ